MKRSERLVFFGTDNFSAEILKGLIGTGWPVIAVVTKPDSLSGRGQTPSEPVVKLLAQKHKIKVLQPESLLKIVYEIAALEPSHGVLASYGKIIPASMIDIFPGGIVNVHPSMLPKYRGASPIETAILNGDPETGISLMQLNIGMDEGPVYAQKSVVIHDGETKTQLTERLAEYGSAYLLEKLPNIVDGSLQPEPQDDSKATYTKLLKKEDGRMDWTKSAQAYERQIRAYQEFPRSTAEVNGKSVIITKARIAKDENDGDLVIKCRPGYLELVELIAPSGKTMSGSDFNRGYLTS